MTSLEIQLTGALLANAKLREEAEGLLAAYVEPGSNRDAVINHLIALFDGPQQRRARGLAEKALTEAQRAANKAD